MADQDTPSVPVTDKRSAARAETSSSAAPEPNAPPSTAVPESDPTAPPPSPADQPQESSDSPEDALPDPAAFVAFAAMQMDTRALAAALFSVFDGHAWRALGLVADPRTGETRKDLPTAQLAIDSVQFFLSKIESDLPDAERREAQRRLNDLRMNYLTKLRET